MSTPYGINNDDAFRQRILTASWQEGDRKLARKITGCDLDHFIHTYADGGAILFCEFKGDIETWEELLKRNRAQFMAFAGLVERGHSIAALCKHSVPTTRDIDVRNDVDTYNLMGFDVNTVVVSSRVIPGSQWFEFVNSFVKEPSKVCYESVRSIRCEE